jgi:nitronate monooxygenase
MMTVRQLFGIDVPIIQAPMAGVQAAPLAIAVSNAGGLGSLPCAMLSPDDIARELREIKAGTTRPFNVNFFCHAPPPVDAERDAAWRATLAPYYRELGVDATSIKPGAG